MSNKFVDLTGQTFGRLTVLGRSSNDRGGRAQWNVKCVCGNNKVIASYSLRSGATKSCGCMQKERVSIKRIFNLIGRQFGRLTVINLDHTDTKGHAFWLCQCSCNNKKVIDSSSLRSGATKSCGCMQKELASKRATKHGLTHTKEYNSWKINRREEKKKLLDSFWSLEDSIILKLFSTSCVICGSIKNLTVDHLLPLDLGYGLAVDNAIILCLSCNSSKNNKYITELAPEIRRKLIEASCAFQDYYDDMI